MKWTKHAADSGSPAEFRNQGAGGMGYGAPASVGAALAAKNRGRFVVNIQCDGDLNYAPGVLWTAVHHKLPMLTIMHNNRAWHQEFMYVVYMAGVRGRGTNRGTSAAHSENPSSTTRRWRLATAWPAKDPFPIQLYWRRPYGVASIPSNAANRT